jgi:SWI/SNF-related matrix-associated actin-dependent regulator 1 of chromatin subfamily A
MRVTYSGGLYRVQVSPEIQTREMQGAGWRLHPSREFWFTSRVEAAAQFAKACVGDAKKRVDAWIGPRVAAIEASCALDSDLEIPAPPGKTYRAYQKAGIAFMSARYASLNADAMRLGKTIQAIGVANMTPVERVLVICPATAKEHWRRKWAEWTVHDLEADYCVGSNNPETPCLIINYDILDRHDAYLKSIEWDIVIVDESRALKNDKALRTRVVFGRRGEFAPLRAKKHWLFLDGTPDPTGRPIDLWTIVKKCDPNGIGANWLTFVRRYCGAHNDGFGLKVDGAENLEELQFRMRTKFMVRREKQDVIGDIEPNRQTILLPSEGLEPLLAEERNIVRNNLSEFEAFLARLAADTDYSAEDLARFSPLDGVDRGAVEGVVDPETVSAAGSLSTVRRELALQKCGMCVDWIKDTLTSVDKIIVFAHHRDVVKKLQDAFPGSAVVIGGMTDKQKWAEIDRFTNDPECRVFIGNMIAAGQIINLSVADDVVFVEMSWVPGEMDQCEERAWEVGKDRPISVWRLVVKDSLDEVMCRVLDKRQKDIAKTLNVSSLKGVKL